MKLSGISHSTYDRWSSAGGTQENPEIIAARRAANEKRLAEEAALQTTNQLVGSFIAAREAHLQVVQALRKAESASQRAKARADGKPNGILESFAWALASILGFSPNEMYAKALRSESKVREEVERLRRERESALRKANSSADSWNGRYFWSDLDSENGVFRC